jgi:hypothetical protein
LGIPPAKRILSPNKYLKEVKGGVGQFNITLEAPEYELEGGDNVTA